MANYVSLKEEDMVAWAKDLTSEEARCNVLTLEQAERSFLSTSMNASDKSSFCERVGVNRVHVVTVITLVLLI